jgi:hypothetical protein
MAQIKSINIKEENEIIAILSMTKNEYKMLEDMTKNLILLPTELLENRLTTGTLGNSNRIMLPNKILNKHNVTDLLKKVPAKIFKLRDDIYLLIKLQESKLGIPVFSDDNIKKKSR